VAERVAGCLKAHRTRRANHKGIISRKLRRVKENRMTKKCLLPRVICRVTGVDPNDEVSDAGEGEEESGDQKEEAGAPGPQLHPAGS
jgi:hypothetical protein